MMNWRSIQERLNEIIQVDVMADEEWDFMATHMPFIHLTVQDSGRTTATAIKMSEENVYQQLIRNSRNAHRMIIVRGPNGAGKSHLIRWLRSRMLSDEDINHEEEKIIFIRRIDNTLRGTVRQLLDQGVVSDTVQQERLRNFIQSSDIQNEAELKSTIYYAFLTKVETEQEETEYRSAERRRIATFLRDDDVKNYLMGEHGPISRFYELIAKPHGITQQVEASFKSDDFTQMRAIMTAVQRNGNVDTKQMIGRVLSLREAERLAVYLNRFSNLVIQQCANIAQGDIDDMIRQLRLNLKRDGKNLTVMIEDMTTFTGMDAELVKVLSVPHEGEYKDMCRVTSVIGITDAYYDAHFRGNFQNRVTHQISIDETSFNDAETLSHMAALYINAAYLSKEEVLEWYRQGASQDSMPYRTWEPNFPWPGVIVGRHRFTLFPFTQQALVNLFHRLPEKTPRFFIRDVIKAQLNAWVVSRLEQGTFPNTNANTIGEKQIQFVEPQHAARFESISLPKDRKQALRVLLCLWGTGLLVEAGEVGSKTIADLPKQFLELLGYGELDGVRRQDDGSSHTERQTPDANSQMQPVSTQPPVNKDYRDQLQILQIWYENKAPLSIREDFARRVRTFLIDAINWQLEGVPAYLAGTKLTVRNIYIEGQRLGNSDTAPLVIKRDSNSYWMLVALTHWYHHGQSWDFSDAPFFQYKLISWLELNKEAIISSIKGEPQITPTKTLQWSMGLEFLRLGLTGGLAYTDKDDTLLKKLFVKSNSGSPRTDKGDVWGSLLRYIQSGSRVVQFEENSKALVRLANTHMGSVTDDRGSKYLFHRYEIDNVFTTLKSLNWDATPILPEGTIEHEDLSNMAAKLLHNLLPKVMEVLEQERSNLISLLSDIQTELGKDLDKQKWEGTSREVLQFLNMLNNDYRINFSPNLRTRTEAIEINAVELARICKRASEVIEVDKFSLSLMYFSGDPCKLLEDALSTIRAVKQLAVNEADKADSSLASLRQDLNSSTQLVQQVGDNLISLITRLDAIGGVTDVD